MNSRKKIGTGMRHSEPDNHFLRRFWWEEGAGGSKQNQDYSGYEKPQKSFTAT